MRPGDRQKSIAAAMDFSPSADRYLRTTMIVAAPRTVVHLELHTPNLGGACALYSDLCAWRPQRVETASVPYHTLDLGAGVGGGIVECRTERALWLPYVEVRSIVAVTERAQALGASVTLAPREGPYGWRSVVTTAAGGEIGFWQPKCRGGCEGV
jgi:predicted enzyme related to lactoylglutathione lyase